jgi:integrase/recombinase XerD
MKKVMKLSNKTQKTFDDFIVFCKVKNLRDVSINEYKRVWKEFTKVAPEEISEIEQKHINKFIVAKKESGAVKATTINHYLKHLKVILNFLEVDYDISFMKTDANPKVPYSRDEIKKLLAKPNIEKSTFSQYRNWVIINLLIATGARGGTIINILVKDVDLENNFISFNTLKNRKSKKVPIPAILSQILKEYLEVRKGKPDDYLFPNQFGNRTDVHTLNASLNRYNKSREVFTTGLHRFRHTFAKEFILAGGDIVTLQHILTHASIEQTREYINMLDVDVQSMVKINPLEVLTDNKTKLKIS